MEKKDLKEYSINRLKHLIRRDMNDIISVPYYEEPSLNT